MADLIRNPQPSTRVRPEGERLNNAVVAESGAGLVQVQVDARGTLRSLTIAPEAFDGRDADLLADLVLGAIVEAQRRVAGSE